MSEIILRYNEEAEEVELVVDNEVALTSGADVFASWVEFYNEAHPPVVEETHEETAETDEESVETNSDEVSTESESEDGQAD